MATPNPARLSAMGNKTLTLAMERQRLLAISPLSQSPLNSRIAGSNSSSSVAQITRNLNTIREGIVALESDQEAATIKQTEALREQYANILNVLGEEDAVAAGIPR
jgi:syntaxin 8